MASASRGPVESAGRATGSRSCCVVVLTYNGLSHLERCVPSILAAAAKVEPACPVVVVDNRSTDRSVEWMRAEHPEVDVVVAERNDYLFSLNSVVASRQEEIVVILNNDMHFDPDFIVALLPHFDDESVFAVMARVDDWDGTRVTTGQRLGEIRRGWFYRQWAPADVPCLTLDAGGGSSAYRREPFVKLGGFDPLYRPAYWEDTDLSYRAWRAGTKVVYEPRSRIFHRCGATLEQTEGGSDGVKRLVRRNELLFQIRNVGGWGFVAGHLLLLPLRALRRLLSGDPGLCVAALSALPRIPLALQRRWADRRVRNRGEHEFLTEIRATATAQPR